MGHAASVTARARDKGKRKYKGNDKYNRRSFDCGRRGDLRSG